MSLTIVGDAPGNVLLAVAMLSVQDIAVFRRVELCRLAWPVLQSDMWVAFCHMTTFEYLLRECMYITKYGIMMSLPQTSSTTTAKYNVDLVLSKRSGEPLVKANCGCLCRRLINACLTNVFVDSFFRIKIMIIVLMHSN